MVQYVRNNKQYLVCSLKNTDQLRDKVMNMSTTQLVQTQVEC